MKWKIPCSWIMTGEYEVEADNIEEAIEKVFRKEIPNDGVYLNDSFQISVELLDKLYPEDFTRLDYDKQCKIARKSI